MTGLLSVFFLLQPPRSLVAVNSRTERGTERSPAAVVNPIAFGQAPVRVMQQAVDVSLKCQPEKLIYDRSVAQIRLSGTPCGDAKAVFVSSEIVNEANGFSATVFHPTDNSFTTDYISLSPGSNKIRIMHQFAKGVREEHEYLIERGQL